MRERVARLSQWTSPVVIYSRNLSQQSLRMLYRPVEISLELYRRIVSCSNSDNGNSSVTVYSTTTDKNENEIDVVGRTINYVATAIKNSITYYNSLPENARKYVDMYLDVSEENTSEE